MKFCLFLSWFCHGQGERIPVPEGLEKKYWFTVTETELPREFLIHVPESMLLGTETAAKTIDAQLMIECDYSIKHLRRPGGELSIVLQPFGPLRTMQGGTNVVYPYSKMPGYDRLEEGQFFGDTKRYVFRFLMPSPELFEQVLVEARHCWNTIKKDLAVRLVLNERDSNFKLLLNKRFLSEESIFRNLQPNILIDLKLTDIAIHFSDSNKNAVVSFNIEGFSNRIARYSKKREYQLVNFLYLSTPYDAILKMRPILAAVTFVFSYEHEVKDQLLQRELTGYESSIIADRIEFLEEHKKLNYFKGWTVEDGLKMATSFCWKEYDKKTTKTCTEYVHAPVTITGLS